MRIMKAATGAVAVGAALERLAQEHNISVREVLERRARGQLPKTPLDGTTSAVAVREAMAADMKRRGLGSAEYHALRAAGHIPPLVVEQPRCTLTCYLVEAIDEKALREVHPGLKTGDVVRIGAPWTERVVVAVDGRDVVAFTPTDQGAATATDVSWTLLVMICRALGHRDPAPETSDQYVEEALAFAVEALAEPPIGALSEWLGKARARRWQAIDRMRMSFRAPEAVIAGAVGQLEAEPLPSLWPVGADATRIEEQRHHAAEEAERARVEAARIEVERQRMRTPAELGAVCIEVRSGTLHQPPAELGVLPPSWRSPDGSSSFHLVQPIEGLPVPLLDLETFHVIPPTACIVPPGALPPARPSDPVYRFVARLIEIDTGVTDTGPVSREAFRVDVEPDDARLLDELARIVLVGTTPTETFLRTHLPALLVRGRLLDPAVVDAAVWDRVTGRHAEAGQTFDMPIVGAGRPGARMVEGRRRDPWVLPTELPRQPLRTAISREELGRLLVQAAGGGLVKPGALLPSLPIDARSPSDRDKEVAEPHNSNHRHQKRNTKKG